MPLMTVFVTVCHAVFMRCPKILSFISAAGAHRYTQFCPRVVIPAGMPDPLEREANPVPWTVTRN